MKKKILSILLCTTMIATMMQGFTINSFAEQSADGPLLAYVPLDNRPVNVDRVVYEAESAGFQVVTPDEDLYATRLDGQPLNSNGTPFGDREKLLDWIKKMDKETDYFVISLDQILSGGLVNSRTLYNDSYSDENEIMDAIAELSKNNHVYLIDTVMRLASCTVDYQNATLGTYNYLRQYSGTPRALLKDKFLTVDNIVAGYTRDNKGRPIFVNPQYSQDVINSLKTRERKLRLIDYILTRDNPGKIKYFIGIDDSNSDDTIQTNEVNYIKQKMAKRGTIYSGADELGMMAVLSLMIDYFHYNVTASAEFFGNTERSSSGSIYDMETVKENVEEHLKSIGVKLASDKNRADIEIMVLTSPSKSIMDAKYISRMIDGINDNISKGIPTIVINSAPSAYGSDLEYRMVRECEMSMLLSYSSWGTVGNSVGLALCNGISRYLYLHSRNDSSDAADVAFLKGLIFSYEKDISYLRGGGKDLFVGYLKAKGLPDSNFYRSGSQAAFVNYDLEKLLKTTEYNVTINDIIKNLTDRRYLKGLGGECGSIGNITLSNYSAPFFRANEIRFDINVDISYKSAGGGTNPAPADSAGTAGDGTVSYPVTLYYLDGAGRYQKLPCVYDKGTGGLKVASGELPDSLLGTLGVGGATADSQYADVTESSWYFDSVMYVSERGIMQGVTDSTFEPKTPMNRAALVYTLYTMEGKPAAAKWNAPLPDVGNSWYRPAVEWALANNIVSGYENGNFGPGDLVTREQLACILWRYAKYRGMDVSKGGYPGVNDFKDAAAVTKGLSEGFDWASSNGIISGSGDGTKLMPQSPITRAEVAAVLQRFDTR